MGTVSNTTDFREGGAPAPVSRGGKRLRFFIGKVTMSSSYATGGDTLQVPTLPAGFSLVQVHVAENPDATPRFVTWDGSTSTPKLKAFVESAGVMGEVANATNLSAVTRNVLLVYEG